MADELGPLPLTGPCKKRGHDMSYMANESTGVVLQVCDRCGRARSLSTDGNLVPLDDRMADEVEAWMEGEA